MSINWKQRKPKLLTFEGVFERYTGFKLIAIPRGEDYECGNGIETEDRRYRRTCLDPADYYLPSMGNYLCHLCASETLRRIKEQASS
jgi:hypothetical protein